MIRKTINCLFLLNIAFYKPCFWLCLLRCRCFINIWNHLRVTSSYIYLGTDCHLNYSPEYKSNLFYILSTLLNVEANWKKDLAIKVLYEAVPNIFPLVFLILLLKLISKYWKLLPTWYYLSSLVLIRVQSITGILGNYLSIMDVNHLGH